MDEAQQHVNRIVGKRLTSPLCRFVIGDVKTG